MKETLFKILLDDYSQRLSNDSCNDFDLSEFVSDKYNRYTLICDIESDWSQEFNPNKNYQYVSNISLLDWLRKNFKL